MKMSETEYWVWLASSGLTPYAKSAVLRRYEDAKAAYYAPRGEIARLEGVNRAEAAALEKRDLTEAERIIADCAAQGLDIISYRDARYPVRLKSIAAPPPVLYVKGSLPKVDKSACIAVIGTRNATPYGIKMARNLAEEIVFCGGIVVSGLTRGIDAAAAEAALNAGGVCIGVLGTPHSEERGSLAAKVAERGALISEYAPGTAAFRGAFRERNRIASGLSVGVVAVEAPETSGTLLFADEAAEQGREIFAVPGNADRASSAGTLALIKDGAKLVTCGWDVMSEFEFLFPGIHRAEIRPRTPQESEPERAEAPEIEVRPPEKTKKVIDKENGRRYIDLKDQLKNLSEVQLKIISTIDGRSCHVDDIVEQTGLSAAVVLAQLTILEIKGFVRRDTGRRVTLNTAKK